MKIDLTAPVELWDTQLPTRDYPACALKLYNLTDMLMISVEVTLLLLDQHGEEQSRVLYRAHDLHGEPGKTFRMAVPLQARQLPDTCEVVFEKVWYENGTVWRRTRNSTLSFTSNVLPKGRDLDMLRLVAGETAVGFPEEQENGWVCVCGRPNAYETDACIRCQRKHQDVMQQYNQEAVAQFVADRQAHLDAKARQALEDAAKRREARAQQRAERSKKLRNTVISLTALAAAGVLAYGTVCHLLPYVRYRNAVDAFAAGRYTEAQTAFDAMPGYRDADAYVLRCRYQQAAALLTGTDQQRLQQAEAAFEALGDYEDAAAKALEARRLRADALLNDGSIVPARDLYRSLNDAAMVTECDYLQACDMALNGDHAAAMDAFAALGDYKDAAARRDTAALNHAAAMLTASLAPDDVLALLATLPEDNAAAAALRQQAWYRKGKTLQAEGDNAQAALAYRQAGTYQDAAALASICVYEPACAAQAAGNLAEAARLFAAIPGYEDADDRWYACTLSMAASALDDLEYKLAASLLAQLPEDDAEANALRLECLYRPAAAAMGRKDYAAAIEGFSQLGDYSDSAKQLNKARYAYAGQLESTDPDTAMALYEALGEYSDSAKKLRTLRYNTAVAAQAAGDLDRAEALLTLLGNYRDCAARMQQLQYARAEALLAEGKTEEAIAAFTALGSYKDSAQRIQQIHFEEAKALLEQSKQAEALAAFIALGEYPGAADYANQIRYTQAEALLGEDKQAEAIAVFAALGEYSDAADRANQLRYTQAEALVAAGSTEEAITAFAALGEYSNAADRSSQLRYTQAELLQTGGELESALALFQQLGEYSDSADHVQAIRYQLALSQAANGDFDEAVAAFTALGDYSDAAARINAVRYQQAEAQLAEGNADAAISTFTALGEYADSASRILAIRYDAAAKLAAEGSYAKAEEIYAVLGEYSDSAERVLKMRYCQAEVMLSTGAWEKAKAAFIALGEYSDAADRTKDCDLLHANQLLAAGDEAGAEALYIALGDYADAADRLKALYYSQAKRLEDAGDLSEAAKLYIKANDYEDAAQRATVCLVVFSQPYQEAQAAMEQGDAATAVALLRQVNYTDLPEAFRGMLTLYAQAADKHARTLMDDGRPDQTAALLEQLPASVAALMDDYTKLYEIACTDAAAQYITDSPDAALPWLLRVRTAGTLVMLEGRADLLLLGSWTNEEHTWSFEQDGQCTLDGEALYYALDGYNLLTGPAPDALTVTHKIAVMPTDVLHLRDIRNGGNERLTFTWVGPCALAPLAFGE